LTEIVNILEYAKFNPVVFTALKLMSKYGMRIGAFEKMKMRGKKAVTKSKGGNHSFEFDDEDLLLWEANPLNKYTAKQLGDKVNYLLIKAWQEGIVEKRYSAHKIRHFVAKETYLKTGKILDVKKKLGHRHIGTTETYLETLDKEGL